MSVTKQNSYPVQLLQDRKGIYGIGLSEEDEFIAKHQIVLRPDKLSADDKVSPHAVLQMIPSRNPYYRFELCLEGQLRSAIYDGMLGRAGISGDGFDWMQGQSTDPDQQKIRRNKVYGLQRASFRVINRLLAKALAGAAHPCALKQARRFALWYRYQVYHESAISERFLQLTSVFPALALAISDPARTEDRLEALHLVYSGAPLRRVAEAAGVPMALRKVKPGAAHLALEVVEFLAHQPDLVHAYMPLPLPRMKPWLRAVRFAARVSSEFGQFTARNFCKVGGTLNEDVHWLEDVADWVRACTNTDRESSALVTRRFSPDMSINTVTSLSREWHEAAAINRNGGYYEFPEPWAQAGKVGDNDIVPISNSRELYREGDAMHHCVGTYGKRICAGLCYIFSLRKEGMRIATIKLVQSEGRVSMGQIRGPYNAPVTDETKRAARKWLKSQHTFRLPPVIHLADLHRDDDDLDLDFDFE
jgi:hypothetical protein